MKSLMMATRVLVHAFLLIISLPISQCRVQPMDEKLIESICKKTPNFDLCVSSLKSDPKSSTADVPGLSLIMVDIIKAKATKTLNRIHELLKRGPGGFREKQALSSCANSYNVIIEADVPEAIEALTRGGYKFAEDGIADAAVEADICEHGFSSLGSSPLTDMNKDMNEVSNVARAIVRTLL